MKRKWYVIDDVNPQPWAIGPLAVGRRPGGFYPFIGQNTQLATYQRAIKEELFDLDIVEWEGDVQLQIFLWRRLERIVRTTKRTANAHGADTTNLQKGLEDALQGVCFGNDRLVRDVRTILVEQSQTTIPRIVFCVSDWSGLDPSLIPDHVWAVIDKPATLVPSDNSWKLGDEEIF